MLARIFLSLGLGLYAFATAQSGLDRISGQIVAMERLVLGPFRSEANRASAAAALSRVEAAAALSSAQAAVASDPIDPASTALLGAALLMTEDDEAAAAAFRVAAQFGWRNLATQAYWLAAAVEVAEFDVAMDRADAILRVHQDVVAPAELLALIENEPQGRAALADHLQHSPGWLEAYLTLPDDGSSQFAEHRLEVLALAGERGAVLGCQAVASFTTAILRQGRYQDATNVWNQNCPKQRVGSGITDTKFKQLSAQTRSPFGWRTHRSGNVSIGIEGEGAHRSLALINRASVTRIVLDQVVNLPPGHYRMTVEGEAGAGKGMGASLGCDAHPSRPSPDEMDLSGKGRSLRAGSCAPQTLALWLVPTEEPMHIKAVRLMRVGK